MKNSQETNLEQVRNTFGTTQQVEEDLINDQVKA